MHDEIADNPDGRQPEVHEALARPSLPRYTLEEVCGSIPGIPGMSIDLDDEIGEAVEALAEKYGWLRRE